MEWKIDWNEINSAGINNYIDVYTDEYRSLLDAAGGARSRCTRAAASSALCNHSPI